MSVASTTDDFWKIDVRRWHREGLLAPGCRFTWVWRYGAALAASIQVGARSDNVVLSYRHRNAGGRSEVVTYKVEITRTRCHLGGSRPWFICPARGCGRRVAILYGGAIFACRRCHRLAYQSTRENAAERAMRRTDKIRGRLGWTPGILNRPGDKPKWMRWRTFERLHMEHDVALDAALAPLRQALKSSHF